MVTIPTVAQIRQQIIADIEGRIGTTIPILPKAFLRVLATALAGALALLYRVAAWVYRQIFPQTADDEALARIGERYNILRIAAVRAKVTATATGDNGTTIPAGTLWVAADGQVYSQTEAAEIAAGTATITIEALTAGDAGNREVGDILSIASPIAGLDSTATVASTVTTGEDQEAIEDYRTRVMERMQNAPQGGAVPDYVGWAREVAGIVKAFAFRTGAGYVTVYPLQAITGADRIPAPAKIAEVEAYVGADERRPLCANVVGGTMTELDVDITITGLIPNEAETKADIQAALEAYLYAAYPRQYIDEPAPTDIVSVAAVWAAVAAAGATASAIAMLVDSNPATAYTLDEDEIVTLGALTWA
jgi:uncharacterized phage protein gp47/JayE